MSMETANKLLSDWREINRARGGQAARPSPQTQTYSPTAPPPSDAAAQIGPGMDRMRLTGGPEFAPGPVDPFGRPPLKPPPQERPGADYPQQLPPQQSGPMMGYNMPPSARPPPGARIPIPPGYPQDQLLLNQQQSRPPMGYEQAPQAAPDGFPAPYQVGRSARIAVLGLMVTQSLTAAAPASAGLSAETANAPYAYPPTASAARAYGKPSSQPISAADSSASTAH